MLAIPERYSRRGAPDQERWVVSDITADFALDAWRSILATERICPHLVTSWSSLPPR